MGEDIGEKVTFKQWLGVAGLGLGATALHVSSLAFVYERPHQQRFDADGAAVEQLRSDDHSKNLPGSTNQRAEDPNLLHQGELPDGRVVEIRKPESIGGVALGDSSSPDEP